MQQIILLEHSQFDFRSYWANSSSNRSHDGVGILIRSPLCKFIQTIDSWEGRLLKIDLFFHQTKLSIISVYVPPSSSVHRADIDNIYSQPFIWLNFANSHNYHIIILGDFNADEIAHSYNPPSYFKILRLLSSRLFHDHKAYSSNLTILCRNFIFLNNVDTAPKSRDSQSFCASSYDALQRCE